MFRVTLAGSEGEPLSKDLQFTDATCNYENFLLIGESEGGTYYLMVEPDVVSSSEGDFNIELTLGDGQNEQGPLGDAADQPERAVLINVRSIQGEVGELDRADYYTFDATLDTALIFIAKEFALLGFQIIDANAQLVCQVNQAPEGEQLVFKFDDSPISRCGTGLKPGRYVFGIISRPDQGGLYEVLIR